MSQKQKICNFSISAAFVISHTTLSTTCLSKNICRHYKSGLLARKDVSCIVDCVVILVWSGTPLHWQAQHQTQMNSAVTVYVYIFRGSCPQAPLEARTSAACCLHLFLILLWQLHLKRKSLAEKWLINTHVYNLFSIDFDKSDKIQCMPVWSAVGWSHRNIPNLL